ncbi:hypothetical protein ONA91_00600 [Micromonospora sp. DR5-3]|uniref:hypothetical protein n=1 Tax=unclassified Micromonospora TaxID=2617518 RepID=UPI0011DA9A6D|nr:MULTISPECIES: hypothetical protein [unclassified Micromonospora]MCW3812957.1 hypothetical protein [Micromonospora sp. DR5-3]TYC26044.1 hypothetical protein FXF52_01365 [Micromonospora sp. MP36]
MTQPKTNRIPAPLYAAAGAGELALEQLRKLPAAVSDLGTRVVAEFGGKAVVTGVELRQKATETLKTANQTLKTANLTATGLREKAVPTDLDLDKLREAAGRNAAAVLAGAQERAQAAQARAVAAYAELVARGERVVGAGVLEAADTVNADIEATESVTPPAEVPTPTEVAAAAEAKPAAVKRTRATKATATRATAAKSATPSAKLPKTTKRTRPAAE